MAQYSGWELLQRTVEEAGVKITIMRRPAPSACDPLGFSNTIISFLDRKQTGVWFSLNESGEIVQAGGERQEAGIPKPVVFTDLLKGQTNRGYSPPAPPITPLLNGLLVVVSYSANPVFPAGTECGQEFPLPTASPKRCGEHERRWWRAIFPERISLHRVLRWAALGIVGLPLGLIVVVWALLEFVLNDKWEPGAIWKSLR